MNRFEVLLEWYHKENERSQHINEALNIPIGILTGLIALFFYMFSTFSFEHEKNEIIEIFFVVLLALAIICWIIVVILLFGSYSNFFRGYEYKGLPYPTILNSHFRELEKYVADNKNSLDKETTPEKLFEQQLIEMISEYLNRNIEINDRKYWLFHVGKKFLLACIILAVLSSIPYIIHIL